jgi:hypothetical protein
VHPDGKNFGRLPSRPPLSQPYQPTSIPIMLHHSILVDFLRHSFNFTSLHSKKIFKITTLIYIAIQNKKDLSMNRVPCAGHFIIPE